MHRNNKNEIEIANGVSSHYLNKMLNCHFVEKMDNIRDRHVNTTWSNKYRPSLGALFSSVFFIGILICHGENSGDDSAAPTF